MLHQKIAVALWLTSTLPVAVAVSVPEVMRVQGTSQVRIHVGKAGAFGFAGHGHEVEAPVAGTVTVDAADPARSEVLLEFDSASLRVTGEGEPGQDVPEVQRTMLGDRVLDVKRYPKIVFRSRRITVTRASGALVVLSIEGDLSLHGVTKPLTVPVRVGLQKGSLTAEGTATVKQTEFGIQPVAAAGGTVKVKDELQVSFVVHAAG